MREGRGRRGFFKGRRAQPDCARVQRGPDSGGPSSPCPNPCAASLTPRARLSARTNDRQGTFGWLLLHSGLVDRRRYRFFVFVNSSVRGPFMPPYAQVRERGRRLGGWAQRGGT